MIKKATNKYKKMKLELAEISSNNGQFMTKTVDYFI